MNESANYVMQNPLTLITITDVATQSRVQIAPERGAIVTSFMAGDRELLYMDSATLMDKTKNVRGGIPVLFPFPGKLQDDKWQRDGLNGSMPQHGFARLLPWIVEQRIDENRSPDTVSMTLTSSAETLSRYPWLFHATLTFALSGTRLRITLHVQNAGDTSMPYALGFHPYFKVVDKSRARIDSQAIRAFNNVSKQVEDFHGFDFTAKEVDMHLLDHNSNSAALQLGDGSRVTVRASEDFAVWVVWALAGKDFVCLEPWTAPGNALNTGERLIMLPPGQSHESWMETAFAG